jgi:hypothetical protein
LRAEEEKIDKVCMEGREFRAYVGGTRLMPDINGIEKYEVV